METPQTNVYLTGKEGKEYDLDVCANWTKNHRDKNPHEPVSHFFGKEVLQKILAQEGCQGIRFYHGHTRPLSGWQRSMVSLSNFLLKVVGNVEGEKHLIIIGAASDGSDQLPAAKPVLGEPISRSELKDVASPRKYMVAQESTPCPGSPQCPKNILAGNH